MTFEEVRFEEVRIVLQSHCEGRSLRGISRISGLSYNTGVRRIRAASQKAQMVHNAEIKAVDTDAIAADAQVVVCPKKHSSLLTPRTRSRRLLDSISPAQLNGLILSGRVGKHTDSLAIELVTSTEGETECNQWDTLRLGRI